MSVYEKLMSIGGRHTLKAEFTRYLLQLYYPSKMRRQMLDVSPVESLTRLDEVQVVLLELAFLHRLFLCVLFTVLINLIPVSP